jgi:hypothetical protein
MSKLSIRTFLCFGWLLAVGGGFIVLMDYQGTAGAMGNTPHDWPSDSALRVMPGRNNLIMFVHPKCPCSRASIEELNRLLATTGGKFSTRVLFFKPSEMSQDWTDTSLYRAVVSLPGVIALDDIDGKEARRFGAKTSGCVFLYGPSGDLLFKGGITSGRGHAGDNPGENALGALLRGQGTTTHQTPVFGCSLLDQRCASNSTTTP